MLSRYLIEPAGDTFDPLPAAAVLFDASMTDIPLHAFSESIKPLSLSQGYDIQDRFVGMYGDQRVGWKLGMGSNKAMKRAGLTRPLIGQVFGSRCFGSRAQIVIPNGAKATVEFEIGLILARDVFPGESIQNLRSLVQTAQVTMEFILSRFVDRRVVGPASYVADNVGLHALVLGAVVELEEIAEIQRTARVTVDGQPVAGRIAQEDAVDPFERLGALIEHARERHITLKKGTIVSTGSVTELFDIDTGFIKALYLDEYLSASVVAGSQMGTGS